MTPEESPEAGNVKKTCGIDFKDFDRGRQNEYLQTLERPDAHVFGVSWQVTDKHRRVQKLNE